MLGRYFLTFLALLFPIAVVGQDFPARLRYVTRSGLTGNSELHLIKIATPVLKNKISRPFALYQGTIKSRGTRHSMQKIAGVMMQGTTDQAFVVNFRIIKAAARKNKTSRSFEIVFKNTARMKESSTPSHALASKTCGAPSVAATTIENAQIYKRARYVTAAASAQNRATIALECDVGCMSFLGPSEAEAKLSQFINVVNTIFEKELSIKLVLTQIQLRASSTVYPSAIADAGALLDLFRARSVETSAADFKHLITSLRTVNDGVVGLSYVGLTCQEPSYSIGWSKHFNSVITPYILAHELSHNLGADHDPNNIGLMGAELQSPMPNTFSAFSKNQITSHLNALGAKYCFDQIVSIPTPVTTPTPQPIGGSGVSGGEAQNNIPKLSASIKRSSESISVTVKLTPRTSNTCSISLQLGRSGAEARSAPLYATKVSLKSTQSKVTLSNRSKKLLKALPAGKLELYAFAQCTGTLNSLTTRSKLNFPLRSNRSIKSWITDFTTSAKIQIR